MKNSFNEELFITKASNIFVMLHTSIMFENLDRVRHFLSTELEERYEKILKEYKEKNLRKMYDELNVKNIDIKSIKTLDNKQRVEIDLTSRYMDYFIDRNTLKYVSGINDRRIEKVNHLIFEKKIDANYNSNIAKCTYCGNTINVNSNGYCQYCRKIFKAEDYDWILVSIN